MKTAQEKADDYRKKLARDFCTACIANQMCVTFKTAQGYAEGDEIGELWLFLADIAIAGANDGFDRYFANLLKRLKENENLINFDRVD